MSTERPYVFCGLPLTKICIRCQIFCRDLHQPHDLLIAKLEVYGFNSKTLRLIYTYLINRNQRVKVDSAYNSPKCIFIGVPQGSVLGPLLFNVFINDLFYTDLESEICNFADDTTIFACDTNVDSVLTKLESDLHKVLEWYTTNGMCANPSKFQIMFLGLKRKNKLCLNINGQLIPSSEHVKLLGVTIDNTLKFDTHVLVKCKKFNKTLHGFNRLSPYFEENTSKLLLNPVITSNFSYCPLNWLLYSKAANNEINRTHKRALRTLYRDYESNFEEILDRDDTKTIHTKNLQNLMIERYKSFNQINPEYIWEFFIKKDVPYNLRIMELCKLPLVSSQRYGVNSLSFRGSLLWNTLNDELKLTSSLIKFKKGISSWNGRSCTCYICI